MGRRQKYGEPVYFSRAFHSRRSHWGCWQHAGKGRPGKKISLNKWLEWGGRQWYLPAAYSCGEGLVLDLCCQIPRADIQAFLDKWAPLAEREEPDGWPLARRMAVEKEDPLAFDLRLQVLVNGVALFNKRSSCRGWNPCLPETTSRQGAEPALLKRYGLSSASGWQLWRAAFPWRTKSRPRVNSLVVTLDQGPDALPGPCFSTGAPGAEFTFAHPATGVQHTLTVKAYEPQQLEGLHPNAHPLRSNDLHDLPGTAGGGHGGSGLWQQRPASRSGGEWRRSGVHHWRGGWPHPNSKKRTG